MIFHIMKDGARRNDVDGYIVKYEQKKNLYSRLHKMRERSVNGYGVESGTIKEEQVLD